MLFVVCQLSRDVIGYEDSKGDWYVSDSNTPTNVTSVPVTTSGYTAHQMAPLKLSRMYAKILRHTRCTQTNWDLKHRRRKRL